MTLKKFRPTNKIAALFVLCFLALIGIRAYGEAPENPYHDYLLQVESQSGFSGSVLVTKGDSILLAEGFGMANRAASVPNDAETRLLLCSVSKPFTATAIMQLAERGLLSLDDPITKYMISYAGTSADSITIYNLLTHTSGIADYLTLVDSSETFGEPVLPDRVTSLFMNAPREFPPGAKWQYSNSNYFLLGRIIEVLSKISYGEYMARNIFGPLKMTNSGFPSQYLNEIPKSATGYHSDSVGELVAAPAIHSSWPFAAGGLYSTANDLAKFDNALRHESLLTSESITKMFTPFKWRYGCGWEVDTLYGSTVVSHAGVGGGYCSILLRFVDRPFCVVVLSNNEDAFKSVSKIAYELTAIAFGVAPETTSSEEFVTVDPQILEEYVGDYEVAPGMAISFLHHDGKLFTQGPGQPEVEIYARSETEFFLKVVDGSVRFVRDSTGSVSGIVIRQGGRDMSANKIR